MKKNSFSNFKPHSRSDGAVAVEFALGLLAFMVLVLGSLQAMTYAYQLGIAGVATERAARAVAMCQTSRSDDQQSHDKLKSRAMQIMVDFMPSLAADDITVDLSPSGCQAGGTPCEIVTVGLSSGSGSGYQVPAWAPFSVPMPLPASALRTSHPLEMPVNATC